MQQLYEMAVRISLQTSGLPGAVTNAVGMFLRLQNAASSSTAAASKLSGVMKNMGLFMGGAAITAGGLAGLNMIKGWVDAASTFQTAMTGVQMATVTSTRSVSAARQEWAALGNEMFNVASKTQFSAAQVAEMAKVAGTNGVNQRALLSAVLPTLANVAEIDYRLKGIGYQQSVAASVQLAHMFQAYPQINKQTGQVNQQQLKQFQHLLDLAGRSQLVSGLTPDQLVRTVSYLAAARTSYGLSPEEVIAFSSLAGNVGLSGGRGGGSRLAAMFREIATTMGRLGSTITGHNAAILKIEQLGKGDFFTKSGAFAGVANMLEVVMRAMISPQLKNNAAERMSLLKTAFLASGMQSMSVLATPGAVQRYGQILALLGQGPGALGSTSSMQQTLNQTFAGQLQTAKTNFENLAIILGTQLLPPLTKFISLIVQATRGVITFAEQHPEITKFVAGFVAVSTAVALVVGPILMAAGAIGIMAIAFDGLDVAIAPILIIIGAVALAIAGIVLLFENWGNVTKLVGNLFSWVGDKIHGFLVWMGLLKPPASSSTGTFNRPGYVDKPGYVEYPDGTYHRIGGKAPIYGPFAPGTGPKPPVYGPYPPGKGPKPPVYGPFPPHKAPPPGYGGPVTPPGKPGPHVTLNIGPFHLNGADHATQKDLAKHVATEVHESLSKGLKSSHHYGGLMPAGLEPDLWGAM